MTLATTTESTRILAQPLGGGTWRVCATSAQSEGETTLGYIDELGGTYEVRVLESPTIASYVDSFKQAMEFFTTHESTV